MRYWLLASTVTLSSFAIGVSLLAVAEAMLVPVLARYFNARPPSGRAASLLWLRLLPIAGALAFAAAMVLPTFLYYEPANTDEPLTVTMMLIAAAGLGLVAAGGIRIARTWAATARLAQRWRGSGRPAADLAPGLPAFVIDEPFPTVAVVGALRPTLFVSERVLAECSAEEINAMVAHERAHVAAYDNLKRLLLRGCPRLPFAAELESAWSAAAEEAADAAAAAGHPDRRFDLANALIRLARLAPEPNLPAGISAFYPGGGIETRVRLLLNPDQPARRSYRWLLAAAGAATIAAAFIASAPAIHAAMEALVRVVP
jgi:beta-lactamase regulating signal transducer with metallopeptidase domain